MQFVFDDATPTSEFARVVLDGLSGSGKTLTALKMARGLVGVDGTIGVIDTERGRASKYARLIPFKRLNLTHFDPENLTKATAAAAAAGVGCLVVDSGSHFWSGRGGMLERVGKSKKSGPFGGWDEIRPVEQEMLEALLSYPGHLIVTLRVKAEYTIGEDSNGKMKPVKIGLKPDQRDGLEYEFDLAGSLDLTHTLTITKSIMYDVPEAAVGRTITKPGEEFGELVGRWLAEGIKLPSLLDYRTVVLAEDVTTDDLAVVKAEAERRDMLALPVLDEYGQTMPLVELIRIKWREASARGRGASSPKTVADAQHGIETAPDVAALTVVGENIVAAIEAGKIREPERTSLMGVYEARMEALQAAEYEAAKQHEPAGADL
ncbi:AAA family ATPase [Nonomuraea sp. NPDC059023]|uniref:AAA family ATPase n=1 Tax=unclassified Nonomuraea TaxID=2593643 RepID=UPI0036736580